MSLINLKETKYKGVTFPAVVSMPSNGGNRLVKYNYPGSNKQGIEYQGAVPRTFTITIKIPFEKYYQQKTALERVLNDGVAGVLTHPTYGDIENVINGEYRLDEGIKELGVATYVVPFEVKDASGIPVQSGVLPAQAQIESQALNDQLLLDLTNSYNVNFSFPGNNEDARITLLAIVDIIESALELARPIAEKAAEITKLLKNFSNNVGVFVQDSSFLASSTSEIFLTIDNSYTANNDTLIVFEGLYSYGDDFTPIKQTTASRIERQSNRSALIANIKTQALSYAYVSASQIEYETTDDLEDAKERLENQYLQIRDAQILSNNSLELLDRLRVTSISILNDALVTTKSIIEIDVQVQQPLSVIVYAYYGSTEYVPLIAELNDIKQNDLAFGKLKFLAIQA